MKKLNDENLLCQNYDKPYQNMCQWPEMLFLDMSQMLCEVTINELFNWNWSVKYFYKLATINMKTQV